MADGTNITIEAQDTSFERNGFTTQTQNYGGAGPSINSVPSSYLPVSKPPFTVTPPVGLPNLQSIWSLGPFDTTYETNTQALFDRSYATARAAALSGPTNVRGGTARIAFELAELGTQQANARFKEVWQNQVTWASVVIQAITEHNNEINNNDANTLQDNEMSVQAQRANAESYISQYGQVNAYNTNIIQAFAAGRHYGASEMTTQEEITGKGIQNGVVNGFGMSSWR